MEASPLTQQSRPESFQPKIIQLYEILFNGQEEDTELSEGFWREFFLHRPDAPSLRRILSDLKPEELLHHHEHPQELFSRAIEHVKTAIAPQDEVALDTLTVFLGAVLSKKYTNPSSDIISVLAGLHDADAVFSNFVGALDTVIRSGRNIHIRLKAVRTAISITSGAYQTGLISYFTHRDLFPALMKLVQEYDDNVQLLDPFVLLGLLANYNKFEFQNPYRLRLDDFVNDAAIRKITYCVGTICCIARDKYVAVQEDIPEGWTLSNTISYLGLGALAAGSQPTTPIHTAEETKALFAALPGPESALLLSTYDFSVANKLFCFNLVTLPSELRNSSTPFSSFLSLTSYLIQHAYRSSRTALYTTLNLHIIQILIEDQVLAKRICSDESKTSVRLCRQRQPYLPIVKGDRVLATVLLDILIDGINHNLRRRLDLDLYISRVRLAYHWSEFWRSLLSFIKFLITYTSDILPHPSTPTLMTHLLSLLAFSLSAGESFLPDPASYDDLFYKLVETGDSLTALRDAFELSKQPSTAAAIEILISVEGHYKQLLQEKGRRNLSPKEVAGVIKQGYETLDIGTKEGLDAWERYREGEQKTFLKKVGRIAVEDARRLVV
ncbi:DUF1741-domain-containing protein [Patellaria atrata CBS 101060]|uniref:DUF1741-domain-containing protein n=1 Tax=Patellaria atrata CBS 101060 TaxID=1346257 RepID=A0A9P4S3I1_9PEZI|nr:DUF1741-domain-containing protein [Patellaria atrata CBS 101060]